MTVDKFLSDFQSTVNSVFRTVISQQLLLWSCSSVVRLFSFTIYCFAVCLGMGWETNGNPVGNGIRPQSGIGTGRNGNRLHGMGANGKVKIHSRSSLV